MTAAQPYLTVSRRPLDLEDYINLMRRHSGWIGGPLFAGLVISVVIACCWPNTYEAKAVMQIRPSRVSQELVQSALTQQLNERIEQMRSNIESRASLATLISDPHLNLYKEERNKIPMDDIEDKMRDDIKIIINQDLGFKKGASLFTLAFQYRTRKGAVDTVNALMARFIAESASTQHDEQETIQSLVGDEVAQAKADLAKQNDLLTKFRRDNEGRLPEQESMNIQALQSLQTQLAGLNLNLQRLANERVTLESQVSVLETQLKLNQSLAQDIADMAPGSTSVAARQNDELVGLNKQIDADELRLQQLTQIYKENYPDIRSLQSSLKVLKKKRDDLVEKQAQQLAQQQAEDDSKPKPAAKKPTNFRAIESEQQTEAQIVHTRALLKNNDTDRDFLLKQQDEFNKEIASYRDRLQATSLLEAPYADLKRDQAAAAEKYEKFQRQKDLTTQSGELISRHVTEYLDTVDAPTTPQKPIYPRRELIVGVGLGVSLMLGLALAGLQEARDSSLKNLKDVRAYTNLPVLCSVPLLENTLLVKRKRRITYLAWSAAVIVGILAVCGSLFYYYTVIYPT
jgi:hypothetical protein